MKRLYPRGEEEFARVLAFSDGVYAIAITLLVLSIDVPTSHASQRTTSCSTRSRDRHPQIISYAISFAVIGRYWLAHHQFFSRLSALDGGLIASTSSAWRDRLPALPHRHPRQLLREPGRGRAVRGHGRGHQRRSRWSMFNRAHNQDLLDPRLTEEVFRWSRAAATAPVVIFLISVPLAFVSSGLACAVLGRRIPYQVFYLNRRKPVDADEQLEVRLGVVGRGDDGRGHRPARRRGGHGDPAARPRLRGAGARPGRGDRRRRTSRRWPTAS